MKRIKGVLLAALLTVTVSMPVYADRSEKVELPQSSTDYYMTVDSGEDGVDIYPSTDKKSGKFNGTEIKDGTVLHIEGETEKDGENWGYTEYQGRHGYVPLDELRPSKDEELAAAGITKGTGADSAGTGIEQGLNDQTGSSETRQEPNDGIAVSGTPRESDDSTDVSGTEKEVSSGGTGEVYGPAVQISPVSTEEQEETDAKPVNGSVAKSFKETKVWYRNPFIWIGTATALAVIGIFGYHLKKEDNHTVKAKEENHVKRSKLFRKKLLPLFLSVAVAGSQVPVMAADFGDTAVVSADADETERSQSIRNQGQTGESSEAGAEDGGTTQNDTDGVSVAGTSDTETEEISQGSDDNISEELDQDDRTDWTSPDSEENVFSDSTENTFGDGTGDGEDSQIEYIKGRPLTEEEEKEQLAPFDSLTSYTTAEPIGNDTEDVPGARAAAYPSYYNAADLGYVTSVKNQEPYGMCWAFGMASLLETSLLSQGLGTYDLSEEHLAYFFANRNNDPLGNTAGDINYHYGTDDYGNQDYHESGNDMLASFFLSTWSGMTTEEDVPMATDETHTKKTGVIPDASKEYDAVAYLKNAYFSDYSVSAMKKMVLANNAVTLMYNAQNRYYNADTAAYSYPSSTKSINHLVTVVGWDDNYSAKNFKTASNVTADGAWIVKNSWGENWGKNGYFYLSYQDGSINNLVAASATNQPKYTNNYFYDGTCGLSALAMYAGDKIASVFRASAGNGKAEKLGEVTLAALTTNNTYKVQVYTNLKNAKDPTSGTPAYATPVTLRQPMAGIMTFQIPEVLISQGSSYSIVVTNAGNATIKYYVEAEVSYGWCEFEPSILSGQSFRYLNSQKEWEDGADLVLSTKTRDIYGITYRIKAHTKTLDSPAKMQISNTSLSMYAGEKKSLSASATRTEMTTSGISWESSDTNIATVSSNGLVTAKHPGTVTISCYGNNAKGIRASCKVTVKLKQPAGLKITSKAYNKINLAWSAVTGCNYYVIYRSENGGKESKLTSMKSSIQSWSDTTVKTGNTYSYRVRAAYVCTGKTTLYGTASTAVSAKTELAKAAASATAVSGPKNTVSWGKVPGASGYRVYRRTGNSDWERIAEVKSNVSSYQDSQIRGITSYTYSVRAYRNVDGKKVFGSYKESRAVLSYPDIQKISAVKKTSSGLKLYWRAQSRATFYNVYRKTKNSTWKKIGTVSGRSTTVSYEDKTAKKGTTYYYAVRAGVKTSEGKKLCGSYAAKSGKR